MISPPSPSFQSNISIRNQVPSLSDAQLKINSDTTDFLSKKFRRHTFFPEYITRNYAIRLKSLSIISPKCVKKSAAENVSVLAPDKETLAGGGIKFSELMRSTAHYRSYQFYGFLSDYFRAYDAGVFRNTSNVLMPSANVPVSVVNFRTGLVTLAEVGLRTTGLAKEHGSGFPQDASGTVPILNKEDRPLPAYFSLLSDRDMSFDKSAETLVLSDMPGFDIEYEYQYKVSGETEEKIAIGEQRGRLGKFESGNSVGVQKPNAKLQYKRIQQRIILDNQPRTLIFPSECKPSSTEHKIQFAVEGFGSRCTLKNIHTGINLVLKGDENSSYILDIPEADYFKEGETVTIGGGILSVRGGNQEWIHIDISELNGSKIILTNG